ENVRAFLDAGAVGINLEDGTGAPDLLCAKIEAVKRVAARAGVDLFVNARTDVYLKKLEPPERALEATLARAARYRAAGCDGVFVPLIQDAADIRAVVAAIPPTNASRISPTTRSRPSTSTSPPPSAAAARRACITSTRAAARSCSVSTASRAGPSSIGG